MHESHNSHSPLHQLNTCVAWQASVAVKNEMDANSGQFPAQVCHGWTGCWLLVASRYVQFLLPMPSPLLHCWDLIQLYAFC